MRLLLRPLFNFCRLSMRRDIMEQARRASYCEAIAALNGLQTNSQVLETVIKERQVNVHKNLDETRKFLLMSGMTLSDLDSIPMIHVTGTKGKGSTCAFCESVLLQHGFKTGFFSSPHLISVTERIRISGRPISEDLFTLHFWPVYDRIVKGQVQCPAYFKFLTIMAFNIFWKEKVDVAIIEVGVGGMYDCTNIIRNPVACGITKLDLDHTSLLGDTLEKIAWQKAGIMKTGTKTYLEGDQSQGALEVIRNYAKSVQSPLYLIPDLKDYDWGPYPTGKIGLYGLINSRNASLALQLVNEFLDRKSHNFEQIDNNFQDEECKVAKPFKITKQAALGMRLCHWPGRTQTISVGKSIYFLDGAHTMISCQGCRSWFDIVSVEQQGKLARSEVYKVLIFNVTSGRKVDALLGLFSSADLDKVIFTTNFRKLCDQTDNQNFNASLEKELERVNERPRIWKQLQKDIKVGPNKSDSIAVPFVDDALDLVKNCERNVSQVQVLVTGSLHLVGAVINQVNPTMWSKSTSEKSISEKDVTSLYEHLEQNNIQMQNGFHQQS